MRMFPARYLLDADGEANGLTSRYCSTNCRSADPVPDWALESGVEEEDEPGSELPCNKYVCDHCGAVLLAQENDDVQR